MDIYKLKGLPSDERATILEGEANSAEEQTFMMPLTDEEMSIVKDDLAKNCIAKGFIDEEYRQAKEMFKARLEPINDIISESIGKLKNRAKSVTGTIYNIPDFENKMMHSVDSEGNVLNSRPLKPEERQYRIPQTTKVA